MKHRTLLEASELSDCSFLTWAAAWAWSLLYNMKVESRKKNERFKMYSGCILMNDARWKRKKTHLKKESLILSAVN